MNTLSRNCRGRGESERRQCRCGAAVYSYRGYETTAQVRIYDAKTGLLHDCPSLVIADVVECVCGQTVSRFTNGSKANGDGSPHVCPKPVTVTIAPHVAPPAAPKKAALPINPSNHWRGVVSTEIHRNNGV